MVISRALFRYSFKPIWAVIGTLQIIVYLQLIKANLPVTTLLLLKELRKVAFLELQVFGELTSAARQSIFPAEGLD